MYLCQYDQNGAGLSDYSTVSQTESEIIYYIIANSMSSGIWGMLSTLVKISITLSEKNTSDNHTYPSHGIVVRTTWNPCKNCTMPSP